MTQDARVVYAYGVVRNGFDASQSPSGIEGAPVGLIRGATLSALVSRLPAGAYGAAAIERDSGDVAWLSPRAQAHDGVLTWAQEYGGVIPLPMFSLWAADDSVTSMLAERSAELTASFDRVRDADEFGLRIHRQDAVMREAIGELDDEIGVLQREAERAPPGQRYLLERKLVERTKAATRRASRRLAGEVFDDLRAASREAVSRPLAPLAGAPPDITLVLNGAFLVERARLAEFRRAVGAHIERCRPLGLTFDFTGPWPPYHFVDSSTAPAGDAP
ncbi:MAG: GvpL/GvpF family gas vesicle protein [Gemmatimonadaceae bacterium]